MAKAKRGRPRKAVDEKAQRKCTRHKESTKTAISRGLKKFYKTGMDRFARAGKKKPPTTKKKSPAKGRKTRRKTRR